MQGTMRAARLHQLGQPYRIEEVPIPDVGNGEALIRVLRAGMNRGEWHLRFADMKIHTYRSGQLADQPADLPVTIGHNGLGEVVEVGPMVHGLSVGDRVVVKPRLTCGFCRYCNTGREHLCLHHRVIGFLVLSKVRPESGADLFRRYKDGLWAEYCRLPGANLVRLKPDDDVDTFARSAELGHGYRALKQARFNPGETVLVNGATGVTGTAVTLIALAMGAARVIAVARRQVRLDALCRLAPDRIATVAAGTEPIRERVLELTEGRGANVLVDLTPGGAETTVECITSLELGGRAALLGGNTGSLQIPYQIVMLRGLEIMGTIGYSTTDLAELVEFTRHRLVDVSPLRPRYYKLEEAEAAVASFEERSEDEEPVWPMLRLEWD